MDNSKQWQTQQRNILTFQKIELISIYGFFNFTPKGWIVEKYVIKIELFLYGLRVCQCHLYLYILGLVYKIYIVP